MTREREAAVMHQKLLNRILVHAIANRSKPIWKSRMYALCYGCISLPLLSRMAKL